MLFNYGYGEILLEIYLVFSIICCLVSFLHMQKNNHSGTVKIFWTLILAFVPFGYVLYFSYTKRRRTLPIESLAETGVE